MTLYTGTLLFQDDILLLHNQTSTQAPVSEWSLAVPNTSTGAFNNDNISECLIKLFHPIFSAEHMQDFEQSTNLNIILPSCLLLSAVILIAFSVILIIIICCRSRKRQNSTIK